MTRFWIALGNEIGKGLAFAWSEKLQILIEMPFFAIFILLLLAFLPAAFFYLQAVKLFWRLLGEIQSGTLEQVYLPPLPSWLVAAAGRAVAALIETLIVMAMTYGIVSAFVTLHCHWTAAALLPMALLTVTAIGYSLIIGGMTLAWRRIQMLQEGLMMLVMIFAIAALPVIAVPGWFARLGRLFPATATVASLYGAMIDHHGVTRMWGTGGLTWLLVTAAAYLLGGILAFRLGERTARTRGTLGAY
jgi:ABC-2 type transport system permease protein